MDREWIAIIANPFSGKRSNRALVEQLQRSLRDHGLASRVAWSTDERHELLRCDGCRCIVVAGGDGTIADVINLVRHTPVAVLPLGNENLFARHHRHGHDVAQLARRVAAGTFQTIDLGVAGGRYFALMLTAGLDADVVHRLAAWRNRSDGQRRVRHLSYALPILASLRTYTYPAIELEADGQSFRGAAAMVFNLPQYALGLPFAAAARGDDGLLDWVVFRNPGRLASATYLLSVFRQRHLQRSDVHAGRSQRLVLRSGVTPVPVQLDGDAAEFTPVTVSVEPAVLRVIV